MEADTEEPPLQYYAIIDDNSLFQPEFQTSLIRDEAGNLYLLYSIPPQTEEQTTDLEALDNDSILTNFSDIDLSNDQLLDTDDVSNSLQDLVDVKNLDNCDEKQYGVLLANGTCSTVDKKKWTTFKNENSSCDNDPDVCEVKQKPMTSNTVDNNDKKKKRYTCVYVGCDKSYTSSHHLNVHIRSHTGQKPFACSEKGCNKAFTTHYPLKAHLRVHTGECPYNCTECGKNFKTSGDLHKHNRIHTGERPFLCPFEGCGRSFSTSNIRKIHVRSHTGERPYMCDHPHCGKAFASSTNFKNHMRIHSGEKPYVCNVPGCEKRFTEYSSLFKHNAVHKPVQSLKCDECGKTFKHEQTLKNHMQSAHQPASLSLQYFLVNDSTQILSFTQED